MEKKEMNGKLIENGENVNRKWTKEKAWLGMGEGVAVGQRANANDEEMLKHLCIVQLVTYNGMKSIKLCSHNMWSSNFDTKSLCKCTFWVSVYKTLAFMSRYVSFYVRFGLYIQNMQPFIVKPS